MQALDINSTMKNAEKVDVTLSATSKTLKAWENKTNQRALKAGGGLTLALTLAACGGSDTVVEAEETTPVDTTPAVDPVLSVALTDGLDIIDSGNDNIFGGEATLTSGDRIETTGYVELDLSAVDIDGQTIIADNVIVDASGGVSVDASDWTVDNVTVQDSTGDVTIDDIQSAGTVLTASDVVDAAATVTFNFDAQAVSNDEDHINLNVDEVTAAVVLSGGDTEKVAMTVTDGTGEASTLASFTAAGITDLNIVGGVEGQDFRIESDLPAEITTIDASGATGDVHLEAAASTTAMTATFALGDDSIEMGNSYHSTDELHGGGTAESPDADMVSMVFTSPEVREGTMTGFETLRAVFTDAATFDGTNVDDLATVDLGYDYDTTRTASTDDADFNDMDATFATMNVRASAQDIEVDYAELASATSLDINIDTAAAAINIGDNAAANDIQLLDAGTVTINNTGDNAATVTDTVDLSNDTTDLTISTAQQLGDLTLDGAVVSIDGTNALEIITVNAVDGDIDTTEAGAFGITDDFADDLAALQTYAVTTDNADLNLGVLGSVNPAAELERVSLVTVDEGSINQGRIDAAGANIETVVVTATDKNTIANSISSNVYVAGIDALQVDSMTLNATDDGNIELDGQAYTIDDMTFTGNGDIRIEAGADGYTQEAAADASAHTGSRTFVDNAGADTFEGSTAADIIIISDGDGEADTVNGNGGNDDINVAAAATGVTTIDGGAGDDDIDVAQTTGNTIITTSAGDDTIDFATATGTFDIDFVDGMGTVDIAGFIVNADDLAFDELTGITATTGTVVAANAAAQTLNDGAVYLFADGTDGTGDEAIGDYADLSDVAFFLSAAFSDEADGEAFIALIDEDGVGGGDYSIYNVLVDADGIDADDITLLGEVSSDAALLVGDVDVIA